MAKESAFFCLNEQFVLNVTGDMIFFHKERFGNEHRASDLPTREGENCYECSFIDSKYCFGCSFFLDLTVSYS